VKSAAGPRVTMRLLAYLLLAGTSLGALTATSPQADRSTREAVLESARHPWLKWPAFPDRIEDMRALYGAEPDGLVWFEDEALHQATASAVEALVQADERGLSPEDYDAPLLAARLQELRLGEGLLDGRTLFDLGLSLGLLRHLRDVHQGRVDPRAVGFDYDPHADDLDLSTLLRRGRDEARIAEMFDRLEPAYPPYQRLKAALATWRALAKGPPLEVAPEVKKLEPVTPTTA
jgi:L,D-transpeptidase YcbB